MKQSRTIYVVSAMESILKHPIRLSNVPTSSSTAVHWYFVAHLTDPTTTEMIDNHPDHEDPRSSIDEAQSMWGDVICNEGEKRRVAIGQTYREKTSRNLDCLAADITLFQHVLSHLLPHQHP